MPINIDAFHSTSPSLYLELIGTATVVDQCTTLGPKLINPIITLPPGALSTWQPPHEQIYSNYDYFMIGEPWDDPSALRDLGFEEADAISPLDVKDLACPTWGLGKSTGTDGSVTLTIGPPWLPLIVPPMEIFSLDPIWASACTGIFSGANGFTTFDLFDPPIALTPATWLTPPTPTPIPAPSYLTTVPKQTTSPAKTAKPASLPSPIVPPAKTGDPGGENSTPPPVAASADPIEPIALPGSSTASPGNNDDPPADSTPPSTDSKAPAAPAPQQGESSQNQAQGLGAIIYNAFGKSGPQDSSTNNNDDAVGSPPVTPDTITIAGQTVVPDPSGMIIGGSSLVPGGSAVTISNTPISLGSSGTLVVGSSTILLPTQSDPPSPPFVTKALTVAGQSFTLNPSAFPIAGTTISAGGPAVTVGGTIVSLGPSGVLAIGSSTTNLLQPEQTYSVAGQTLTVNPYSSAFAIGGTSISAGGPAIAVGGTVISLGPSGVLIIGSSTTNLLPPDRTYTVAGKTFTFNADSSALAIEGTTLSAGGPAATVNGTIISVQPSGTLIVGSRTIPLLTPQSTFSSDINIDGFDVEVEPTFAVVDGVTLSPGAAGVTISGKLVSLESGGLTLDVGTGRFALPTHTGGMNDSIDVQAFTGGQTRGSMSSLTSFVCGVCSTLMLLLM